MAINNPKKKLQATIVMLKGEKGDKGDQGLGGGTWGGIEGDIADQTDLQTALDAKANAIDMLDALTLKANTSDVNEALALKANTQDVNEALATKQNTLTFDDAPTLGSNNPVKSGGIYNAMTGLRLTKVWQNPDPWDAYGYGSNAIQLSESFNEYVVEFITDLLDGDNHSTTFARFKVPSYSSPALSGRTVLFSASEFNKIVTRRVTVRNNSTGFYFSPNLGYRYNMETQTFTTGLTTVCVPVAIYKVV